MQYHNPVEHDGVIGSIDMVRLKVKYRGEDMEEMGRFLECAVDEPEYWSCNRGIGKCLAMWRLPWGESSFVIGRGQYMPNGKCDTRRGFIEFNPNKVAEVEGFMTFWGQLGGYIERAEVTRYDLAVDYPREKKRMLLQKDGRKYSCEISSSVTEYLGQRNAPGRVKVYDKAAEAGIDGPLTRVEMTVDAGWSIAKIAEKWPRVVGANGSLDHFRGQNLVVVQLLLEKLERGESIDRYLAEFDKKTRRKIKDALKTLQSAAIPIEIIAGTMINLQEWQV